MIASIRKRINALKKDNEHGAGWLAWQALDILKEASTTITAPTIATFVGEMEQVIATLVSARPNMVSISNYAMQFKDELESTAPDSKSADNLKKRAAAIVRKLMLYGEISSSRVANNAAKLICKREIVMTCSYSSDVCTTLEIARQKGVDFKVLAVESRLGNISYADSTMSRLAKSGIVCRIIPDNFIGWHVARANIILFGADAISMQGWMINGVPSYSLAQVASHKKVPIYTICATTKFDVRGFLAGQSKPEPGLEVVPLNLLKGIVTEKGILQPEDVYEVSIDDIFRSKNARAH